MKFVKIQRPEIKDAHLSLALEAIIAGVQKRIDKHGREMYISDHEALGVLEEEYDELVLAITSNDRDDIIEEWMDVIVTGVITVASVVAGAEIEAQEAADQLKSEAEEVLNDPRGLAGQL